jgi:hypothetical protein
MTRARRSLIGIVFVSLMILAVTALAAPVPPGSARTVAGTFLSSQATGAAKSAATEPLELRDAAGTLFGYVVMTTSGGYVITAADSDITPILAYSSTGTFPVAPDSDNPAWHLIAGLVADWRENLDGDAPEASAAKVSNQRAWDQYMSGSVPAGKASEGETVWGPLLETQWGEGPPWNQFVPLDPNTGERSRAESNTIAAAQILNFWKYPANIQLTTDNAYESNQLDKTDTKTVLSSLLIPDDAATYDFPTFETLNDQLADIQYAGDETEIAAFIYALGIIGGVDYASDLSKGYFYYPDNGFEAVVYFPSFHWTARKSLVEQNLQNEMPVRISVDGYYNGDLSGITGRHFCVLDGLDSGNGMFHINMGQAGEGDGWYALPEVNAGWATFNVIGGGFCNITPYSGTVSGTLTDSVSGEGIKGVTVTVLPDSVETVTDETGAYSITVPPGTYTYETHHPFHVGVTNELILSDGQMVSADYALEPRSATIAHYTFDGDLRDQSGNINHLTMGSQVPDVSYVDGKNGQAVVITKDVNENWAPSLQSSSSDFLKAEDGLTMEARVKLSSFDGILSIIAIRSYFEIWIRDGFLSYWQTEHLTNGALLASSDFGPEIRIPLDIPLNEWVHIAATYDPAGVMALYINGELCGEQTCSTPSLITHGTSRCYIGSSHYNDGGCVLDEVRVTGAPLTPDMFFGYPFEDTGHQITGQITDSVTNEPVASVAITATPGGATAVSDENGEYSLLLFRDDVAELSIARFGYSAASITNVPIDAPVDVTLDPDPGDTTVAWYQFDGNGEDSSGHGYDFFLTETDPEWEDVYQFSWPEGIEGQAMTAPRYSGKQFRWNAVPGYQVGYPGEGDWTVEIWVYAKSGMSFANALMHKSYFLGIRGIIPGPTTPPPNSAMFIFDGTLIHAPVGQMDGRWVHLAGVYRYRESMRLYIDGVLAAEESMPNEPSRFPYAPMQIPYQNNDPVTVDGLRISAAALDPMEFMLKVTSVEDGATPLVFSLGTNYPNPFNPTTTIPFTLPEDGFTTLVIHNLLGQQVRELVTGRMQPGEHTVVWDGRNDDGASVASGVYLSRLVAGEHEQVNRMLLVK